MADFCVFQIGSFLNNVSFWAGNLLGSNHGFFGPQQTSPLSPPPSPPSPPTWNTCPLPSRTNGRWTARTSPVWPRMISNRTRSNITGLRWLGWCGGGGLEVGLERMEWNGAVCVFLPFSILFAFLFLLFFFFFFSFFLNLIFYYFKDNFLLFICPPVSPPQ